MRLLVPALEDVNRADSVVAEVVHGGYEDAAVGSPGKEAGSLDTVGGGADVEFAGELEGDVFAGGIGEGAGTLGQNRSCCDEDREREQQCAAECSMHV